jgi:peptide/nickel transport system substrate-binding protein
MAQLRPEFVGDPGLLDLRVRRALAHSLDRQALNAGIFEGQGFPTESFVPQGTPAYADVDRALMTYPFDPRRTDQFMADAGYGKDRDGLFAGSGGDRFKLGFRVTAGSEFERMQAILTDSWHRTGFDVQSSVLPAAQARDREVRQKFNGLSSQGGSFAERRLTTAEIGSPANRWAGENRGGWSHAEYDRTWEAFSAAPDRGERIRHFTQLMRLLSENLPWYMLYFAVQVTAYNANLHGPDPGVVEVGTLTPGTPPHYNIHEWEFSS